MTMKRFQMFAPADLLERVTAKLEPKESIAGYLRTATEQRLSGAAPAVADGRAVPSGALVLSFSHDDLDILEQASSLADQPIEEIVALVHRSKQTDQVFLEKLMQNQRPSASSTESSECAGALGAAKFASQFVEAQLNDTDD